MSNMETYLPHRKPFLFVERIETATKERIIGYYRFDESEFFFQGHFPDYPVVPGVLLVEAMAQCGGAGLRSLGILSSSSLFFLAGVDKVKFRNQVRPNDEIRMEIENARVTPNPRMIRQRGICYVGTTRSAEAEWSCIVGQNKETQ